ncbi:MAG: envelope biogenesis factor ElyC [Aestuariibacter sp.]
MIGFYIKKTLGALLQPLPLLIIFLILGIFYLSRRQYRKALTINILAVTTLFFLSTPWGPNSLLGPLERQYHQFDITQSVDYVVVLGCGHSNDGQLPITAQVDACSLFRIAEGIRIYLNNPQAKLITSGYGGTEPFSNARTNMELAIALGVPTNNILIEERPKDTEEEAQLLHSILAGKRFALVTSASHMPRAMKYFRAVGLNPIAAPTGHVLKDESRDPFWHDFPKSKNLYKMERVIYEYLGQLWQWLRN